MAEKIFMKLGVNKIINILNQGVSCYLSVKNEAPSLIIVLFHALFRDQSEIQQDLILPQEAITIDQFRQFITYFLEHNYHFIGPDDIYEGLREDQNYIMITFDDGYANNLRAIDILSEFRIPASFLITTRNIQEQEAYWWDVLYRNRRKQNITVSSIQSEIKSLRKNSLSHIRKYLKAEFGNDTLKPVSELDRPLTAQELKNFAQYEKVYIGNHTAEHPMLSYLKKNEVRKQVDIAQTYLRGLLGFSPSIFAYPNGDYSAKVIDIVKKEGLKIGLTVDGKKNHFPLMQSEDSFLELHRMNFSGQQKITPQLRSLRSDYRLKPL